MDAKYSRAAVASLRSRSHALFLPALRSRSASLRMRAVEAMAALGDRTAVGALVAHLAVAGGNPQRAYVSRTSQVSYVQDFDVEVG